MCCRAERGPTEEFCQGEVPWAGKDRHVLKEEYVTLNLKCFPHDAKITVHYS